MRLALLLALVSVAFAQTNGSLWNQSNVYNQRGMDAAAAGNRVEAIRNFKKSLDIMPDPAVYLNLGFAYTELKDYRSALPAFDAGLELDPNHISLYYRRAIVLYLLGRTREGDADLSYARRRDAAMEQRWADEIQQSRDAARRIASPVPALRGTPDDWFNEGLARYSVKDDRGALDYLTAIIDRTNNPQALLYRASCENNLRFYDLALADATAAIQAKPQWGEAYRVRARVYRGYRNYERALADLNQAIRLNPKLALAYVDRSNLNYAFRPNLQAQIMGDLDRAIEADPQNPFAWHNHAAVHNILRGGQPERAIEDLTRAISLKPDMAASYANRGLLYYQLNQSSLADRDIRQALKLDPTLEQSIEAEMENIRMLPAIRAHIRQMWADLIAGGMSRGNYRCSMFYGGAWKACSVNDWIQVRLLQAEQQGLIP